MQIMSAKTMTMQTFYVHQGVSLCWVKSSGIGQSKIYKVTLGSERVKGDSFLNGVIFQQISYNMFYTLDTSVLSISFEVDVTTGKVGGSLLFERQRRECELPRKFKCLKMLFSPFSRQYLGLKNNQN